ncbi:MAG: hypothetical protein EB168_02360 [Euryarchaeota archaeon]|nr:hypothetical protein [Euryarchaeota archaeon]
MATYRKNFSVRTDGSLSPISGITMDPMGGAVDNNRNDVAFRNYQSRLPEVYSGHPNRVERYNQYEAMDMDSEINACLDIIAEFSTQTNEENGTAFDIKFLDDPSDNEIDIIKKQLQQWTKLNQFDQRAFKLFRNTIKYGDQVFVRDPETFELYWVDMSKVSRVIVNESEGKRPEQYVVRDINPNFENLTVAAKTTQDVAINPPTQGGYTAPNNYSAPNASYGAGNRFQQALNELVLDAEHVVHLSLSEGLDSSWPFGQSVLENVYKVFKQKELLEDALLIYRVQRAPERRVFKIDVGNMPSHMAMAFVERIKNEVHQRRIPSANGGTGSMQDATYNPLSINEDYFFPTTADGRGSSVDVLPGGQNLGEIDDLRYFNNKLSRGLRVPSSYLPTGPDDAPAPLSDGRVGTALIQEYRFNQYCMRLQNQISQKLDDEFKMFLRWRGFNIDSSIFTIKFNSPQNFASYRQAEMDAQRVNVFGQLEPLPYMSKRFLMQRFLGMSEEELLTNEKLWAEESNQNEPLAPSGSDMRGVGVTPGGIEGDLDMGDEIDADLAEPDLGDAEAPAADETPPGAETPPGT